MGDTDRRTVLGQLLGLGAASAVTALTPSTAQAMDWATFFQAHYKELTPEDKERVFTRLRREALSDHGVEIDIQDPQPIPGVAFAYCLNLSLCNGSRRCVTACVEENNQSRDPAIQYIKVIELDRGTMNLESGDMYYEGLEVPREGKVYLPVQCMQCDNPPCVKVCPAQATWKEDDGIVAIDYDWCIGCRYCMVACPYEARHFNFKTPQIPKYDINPHQALLGNRIRPRGVVEKCHFCMQRTRNGHYPACLEACPTGARKFGDLNDPESEVSQILREKRVFVLKEELNTQSRFFYYFD